MRFKRYLLYITLAFSFLLFAFSSFAQQLKLGNNPTTINKSAVLQLDSKNQGLLLTRISDTANIQNPPDGMIIYFTDTTGKTSPGENDGVYVRKNGYWCRQSKGFKVEDKSTIDFYFDETDTVAFHLPDASGGISGLMGSSSIQQTFGGDKIFQDSLISDSVVYAKKIILGNAKNNGDTAFLTTDSDGKVMLANMDGGYWKVGGNYITDDSKAKIGKKSPTDLSISTKDEERIRITKDGNVGIGSTPTTPSDTLTVDGSFKLGAGGSSFERMSEEATIPTSFGGDLLQLLTPTIKYSVKSFPLLGIKQDALVFINPNIDLYKRAKIDLGILGTAISTTAVSILWVRANNDSITVGFMTVEQTTLLGLVGLLAPTISPSFDILYCNPT